MATISNTPRPGYVWDSTDNVWYPIGVGGHSHGEIPATIADAKGDLIAGTAADTVSRLAVGTNGQYLKADSTAGTGLSWATLPSSGKVLQVVMGTTTTTTTNATATYADTTLTATITPTLNTSKVLIMAINQGAQKTNATSSNQMSMRLMRGATSLGTFADGELYAATTIYVSSHIAINYLDSPATTSATTYKTQFMNGAADSAVTVQTSSVLSTIILMEIGA